MKQRVVLANDSVGSERYLLYALFTSRLCFPFFVTIRTLFDVEKKCSWLRCSFFLLALFLNHVNILNIWVSRGPVRMLIPGD